MVTVPLRWSARSRFRRGDISEQPPKFLVQLIQPPVDIRYTHGAGEGDQLHPHGALDLPHQRLLLAHNGVDSGEDGGLQRFLPERGGVVAVFRAVVDPAGAAPHGELLTLLDPNAPAV